MPSSGLIHFQLADNLSESVEVQIMDSKGTTVVLKTRSPSSGNKFSIDLSAYSEGIYFYRLKVDGEYITGKIVLN